MGVENSCNAEQLVTRICVFTFLWLKHETRNQVMSQKDSRSPDISWSKIYFQYLCLLFIFEYWLELFNSIFLNKSTFCTDTHYYRIDDLSFLNIFSGRRFDHFYSESIAHF